MATMHKLLTSVALLLTLPVIATERVSAELSEAEQRRNARIDAFLLDSMRAADLDAWIILTREGNFDPLSEDFGFHLGRGALIFLDGGGRATRWAVVSSLDLVPLRQSGIYDQIVGFERDQSFEEVLGEVLGRAFGTQKIERIGINTSETSGIADGLSATFLELLRRALGAEQAQKLVSAETAVLSFRSKKLPEEIDIYRRAVAITRDILHQTFTGGFLKPGVTTQAELRDHVQALAAERGYTELAWEEEACPGFTPGSSPICPTPNRVPR